MAMQSINRFLWGPTPQEKVRKWQGQLKKEQRMLDREIHSLDLASNKVKAEVKKLAQKGDTKNAKLLAREVVRSNRQKQRMLTSKAQLNSINMQLGHQLGAVPFLLFSFSSSRAPSTAMVKVTGTLQASTEIMRASNSLIKLPQLSGTMREMSAEMMKVRHVQAILCSLNTDRPVAGRHHDRDDGRHDGDARRGG
jgi:charged multivesicular body protein 3